MKYSMHTLNFLITCVPLNKELNKCQRNNRILNQMK